MRAETKQDKVSVDDDFLDIGCEVFVVGEVASLRIRKSELRKLAMALAVEIEEYKSDKRMEQIKATGPR